MSKFKTALIIPDAHHPEQDQKALDLIYKIASNEKLDRVVQLGDLLDFYQVSRYSKNPARASGDKLQYELDCGEKFVEKFTNLAQVTIIDSNHGDRLEKYLKEKAPGLYGLRALSLKNLLNLNKYNANTSGPLFLGNLLVMHGHEYNFSANGAGTTVKKIVEKTGNSVMIGHVHKLASIHLQKRSFSAEGYEMGCVCNFDNDYCLDPDWALGFGFVHYRDNGDKSFHVEQIKIERCGKGLKNRKAFYRGIVYEM